MDGVPLPVADPTPLPLPFGVLKALLLVTFGLHIFAVDVAVGGSILCVGLAARARRSGGAEHGRIARVVAFVLPPAVTFAITLGVAPLLFVQLLYGEAVYTSTVLLGGPWIAFIFLLMAGYALLYRFTDAVKRRTFPVWLGVASTLLLLSLGFLWTNNVTLMIAPERWSDLHYATPHGGMLNLGDPAVVPRFLHLSTAMVAVAGLLLAGLGVHLPDDAHLDRGLARRIGLTVFAACTLAQLIIGPTTVLLQRSDVRAGLLGGSPFATGALVVGALAGVAAAAAALRGRDPSTGPGGVHVPLALTVVSVSAMVLLRDAVRDLGLARHGYVASNVRHVTDLFGAAALAIALAVWIWITKAMFGWVFADGGRRGPELAPALAAPASRRAAAAPDGPRKPPKVSPDVMRTLASARQDEGEGKKGTERDTGGEDGD
jgi:hypothetical protein